MPRGRLQMFTGPMRGGKTETMLFEIEKAKNHGAAEALIFKPSNDTRSAEGTITTFNGKVMPAVTIPAQNPEQMFHVLREWVQRGRKIKFLGLDEVQFYAHYLYNVVDELLENGYNIFAAGLETDYRNQPFGPTLQLLALVKHLSYWRRILPYCNSCSRKGVPRLAFFTQRLRDGEPAAWDEPTIIAGGSELYESRCVNCYVSPPGKPIFDSHLHLECICPRKCDCQNPEPKDDGVAHVSSECPEHNFNPRPNPECHAENHWDDRIGNVSQIEPEPLPA